MRTSSMVKVLATWSVLLVTALCSMGGQRFGVGPEYSVVTGDADDGAGVYGYYQIDMEGPIAAMLEVNYFTGDYDIAAGSGTYEVFAFGGGLVFNYELEGWTPYAGAGAANNWSDFEDLDYDDKLSIFWFGGARADLSETVSIDGSLRYRGLQPDSLDSTVGTIDMDAWVLRVGVAVEL